MSWLKENRKVLGLVLAAICFLGAAILVKTDLIHTDYRLPVGLALILCGYFTITLYLGYTVWVLPIIFVAFGCTELVHRFLGIDVSKHPFGMAILFAIVFVISLIFKRFGAEASVFEIPVWAFSIFGGGLGLVVGFYETRGWIAAIVAAIVFLLLVFTGLVLHAMQEEQKKSEQGSKEDPIEQNQKIAAT